MARPEKLTAELREELCLRIADGETVRQIGADERFPAAQNIYMALARDTEFRDQYAQAREAQLQRWEDELVEIADDGSNDWMERRGKDGEVLDPVVDHDHVTRSKLRIDARKWLMSKRAPKKYGDKIQQEHSGPDGNAIVPILNVSLTGPRHPASPEAGARLRDESD